MTNTIEFDRPFSKLMMDFEINNFSKWNFYQMGTLIHVQQVFKSMIHPSFFDYDCASGCPVHEREFKDELLLLIFRVSPHQIITTLRTDNEENRDKYFGGIGQCFKFDIRNFEYEKIREDEFKKKLTGECEEDFCEFS